MDTIRALFSHFWKRAGETSLLPPSSCASAGLEDVFKTCLQNFLKICLRDIFKTSWRQKKWGYLYLTNLNGYGSYKSKFHKSISDESKANPKSSIRTQWFVLLWNSSSISILRIKISDDCLVLWNQLNSNLTLQNRWDNKNEILSNISDKYT